MTDLPTSGEAVSIVSPEVFLGRYLLRANAQLPGRSSAELDDIARAHYAVGRLRTPEQTIVSIADIGDDATGIDVVTPDVPYLVDSIRAELGRTGHLIEHLLHPQLVVRRDAAGAVTEVLDLADTADVPEGAVAESWMHIEVTLIPEAEHRSVAEDLHRVLQDVHAAVRDAPELYRLIRELADRVEEDPGEFDRDTSEEAGELLRWLADGNFMILGHAAYSANQLTNPSRSASRASGERGVLRGEASISALELLPAYRSGAPVVIFKSPMVSTVRRSTRYDCVTVIAPARGGANPKIHVFLGLITDESDGTVGRVPVVRRRIAEVLHRSGARADSHTGRQLLAALRTLPRDELLEAPAPDLLKLSQLVVDRAERGGIGVFARVHLNRDFVTVLVYFPGDRLGPETRSRVRDVVLANWPGKIIGRDDRIVELGMARMQFLIALRPGEEVPNPDRASVEARVAQVTRQWSDDLADLLTVGVGEREADRMLRRYSGAFPESYKEDFPASTAVADLRRLEALPELDGLGFEVYTPGKDDPADQRLKIFRTRTPLSLGRTMPMLEQMGIEVLDERPYEIERTDGTMVWIYDFGLRIGEGVDFSPDRSAAVVDTLRVLWQGGIEQDGFNALVVRAGLTWQQATVLRAYAKYLRQAGTTFSQGYIEQALSQNTEVARLLIELFETRFDPAYAAPDADDPASAADADADAPQGRQASLVAEFDAALTEVASLDQDRILRSLLGLIRATLRTNHYQRDANGTPPAAFAIKLDARSVEDLPKPRPAFEIWVYSPRVEGLHLRFGAVARGGLRWSDRREDFRTEILGLVKAQMVKNAVIVPVGAKGGFVAKKLPDPAVDREAWLAEGVACYKIYVTSLLELTDDYRRDPDGEQHVVKPAATRCYDGDDPYLVVAADKGTASFSDIANGIAIERGYWLGDAFASGGSVGYDHKALGITARGAWESVRYHFRELGVDVQRQDFTVVGIGDMSGDVFGNGMLRSERIRLVAAFDHRDIFIDPSPDAASSFAERARLFALTRSSWQDYDRSLISAGGGVYSRSLKHVPISDEAARALGIDAGVRELTPNALIHAILTAPVDLLFNGGIGTYVKSSAETQLEAGDKANDGCRADGAELRCRVVGEGGNLGFTQRGRIEYARAGGRINTDAIDNSAGVDTSDHEVNIKILLDHAVQTGGLDVPARNELLAAAADDVARLVLVDNYEQNVLLGVARHDARSMLGVHQRMLKDLERAGELDRRVEFLPTDKELAARGAAGAGLSSPELAVLAAYDKIVLTEQVRDSTVPDEPWFRGVLRSYFPPEIAHRFEGGLTAHPLHREIVTTRVVNDLVNRAGISFAFRAREESGADTAQIVRAYAVAREVFGLQQLWTALEALDDELLAGVPTDAQHLGYHEIRRTIDRAVRWLVDVRYPISDVGAEIGRYAPTLAELGPKVPQLLCGRERDNLYAEVDRLAGRGLPPELALRISTLLRSFLLLDVVEIAEARGDGMLADVAALTEVAALHFALSERLSVDELLSAVTRLPRDDRWSTLARGAIRHDVYATLSGITATVLRETEPGAAPAERIDEWTARNAERVERARATLADALRRDPVDLATVSVALRMMRGLSG